MLCNLSTNEDCTVNFTAGRDTLSKPEAIVLIDIRHDLEQYLKILEESYHQNTYTDFPKSVHTFVSSTGSIYEVVPTDDTAWGLTSYRNPTWPLLTNPSHVNEPFLYIGIEQPQSAFALEMLSKVICCYMIDLNIPADDLHLITSYVLDDRENLVDLPDGLLATVQSCVEAGGPPSPPDPVVNCYSFCGCCNSCGTCSCPNCTCPECDDCFPEPEIDCCEDLTARVEALETCCEELSGLPDRMDALEAQLDAIQQLLVTLSNRVSQHQWCIDQFCRTETCYAPIVYTLGPGREQLITPNVPVRVNFPTQQSDIYPPAVTTGPLWLAQLSAPCIYDVCIDLHFAASDYCQGKKVWADIVINTSTVRVAEWESGNGQFAVSLNGCTQVEVPPNAEIYVLVGTDDTTTPFKTLSAGTITIECSS